MLFHVCRPARHRKASFHKATFFRSSICFDRLQASRKNTTQINNSVCKRKRMPWMTLQSFYVLVSRTTTMAGLRLLQYDNVGLDSLRKQMPDKYLYAWERGYDDNGKWNDNLAVTALRNIRNVQQIEKKTLATKNKTQSLTTNKHNSPAKNSLQPGKDSPSSSPHKRQKRYRCGLCKSTDHTKLNCPQRPVVLSARKLF